jgi:hypothetical protein
MNTLKLRRHYIDMMQEGIAPMSADQFKRIARAVVYLTRRMGRGGA